MASSRIIVDEVQGPRPVDLVVPCDGAALQHDDALRAGVSLALSTNPATRRAASADAMRA